MPSEFGGIPVDEPAPASEFGGIPVNQQAAPHASYLQELWRQADLPGIVKSLKEHPLDTVASAIGGLFAPLNPNFTQSQQGQAMRENLTRSPQSAAAAGTLGALALVPGLAGEAVSIPEEVGVAAKGAAAGTLKAVPNALETSAIKYTGLPQLAKGAVTGAKQALKNYREAQNPAPKPISPEEYYANQSVPAAEVPPENPVPSAPAPAPASAAATPTAKVQPIRPESTTVQESPTVSNEVAPARPTAAAAAKSARYADAIGRWAKDHGMSVKDIADQWEATTPETRGQIILEMKRKGYLEARETIPNTSAQGIVDALKARAQTIRPPAGFSMGAMKQ